MLKNNKISLDLRIVTIVLLVIIGILVFLLKPWEPTTSDRTITVSGESSTKTEPDEYQFSPTYQKKGTDRVAIQQELTAKINEIVAKLKELGVDESDITLASSTYDNYWNDGTNEITSNSLTISVNNKELSQKVQDYLLTTAPEGQITPYATFSTKKRKEVESTLRSEAIADAKQKAETMVADLGGKVGKVITINDNSSGGVFPMIGRAEMSGSAMAVSDSAVSSLPILSGKQELNYNVEIIYELR